MDEDGQEGGGWLKCEVGADLLDEEVECEGQLMCESGVDLSDEDGPEGGSVRLEWTCWMRM